MKPRKAPLRRTPLASGKPLQRKTEMPRGKGLQRSGTSLQSGGHGLQGSRGSVTRPNGPVKARKPARPGAAAEEREGRRLVAERSEGLCEICACAAAREWHHRQNRSQGGMWAAGNGMHLCRWDHAFITEHPAVAYRNGWSVRSGQDPTVVPVLRRGVRVLFDDFGEFAPVGDEGDTAA